jgi:hypothetical protein
MSRAKRYNRIEQFEQEFFESLEEQSQEDIQEVYKNRISAARDCLADLEDLGAVEMPVEDRDEKEVVLKLSTYETLLLVGAIHEMEEMSYVHNEFEQWIALIALKHELTLQSDLLELIEQNDAPDDVGFQ